MRFNTEKISLANLAGGAAIERFDVALQEVLNNIQNVNTESTEARKVVLEVTLKPDEYREQVNISLKVVAKNAPLSPMSVNASLETDVRGNMEAYEIIKPKQQIIPSNVSKIRGK